KSIEGKISPKTRKTGSYRYRSGRMDDHCFFCISRIKQISMKNLITIIATVLFSTVVMSQETPSISIVGEASYNVEKIKNYVIHIQLKDVKSDGYSTFENKTLEQVKADYKNKLSTIGVDFNKFSENKGLYIYSGYSDVYNETVYYTYVTNSEADIINVVKAKIPGLTIMNVE